jgi:hypothetical protein
MLNAVQDELDVWLREKETRGLETSDEYARSIYLD